MSAIIFKSVINLLLFPDFQSKAAKNELQNAGTVKAKTLSSDDSRKKYDALQTQVEQLQNEVMNVQIKYQKELEKLEKENRELRQQYLILKTNRKTTLGKKIKVSPNPDSSIEETLLKLSKI